MNSPPPDSSTAPSTESSAKPPASNASSGFTARIARSFLILAMATVAMVGTVAYIRGRQALEEATYSRLNTTVTLKQNEITRWLESCEEDFLLIAQFPTVKRDIQVLLTQSADSSDYQAAYQRLSTYFSEIQQTKPKFTEISIQNRANQIILSTNPEREGKYEISANLTEVQSVVAGDKFSPNFYISPESGRPAITYANKIYAGTGDNKGKRQGMVLANLNLKRIDDIISARALDSSASEESYLVGSLTNQTAFLSRRDTLVERATGPNSHGIREAFKGQDGEGEYTNYAEEPVLGVYRWLAGQDIALIAEIGRAEAFGPARNLAGALVLVGLSATGLLLLGVSQLAQQLSASRRQIESYSQQLEQTATAAKSANQAKSEFLANMSHELRTPLNAILGFAQLMQRDSLRQNEQQLSNKQQTSALPSNAVTSEQTSSHLTSSSHNEYLNIISRSGEHLLNLINDVLSMSKIEAGRTTVDVVCFDLRYLLLTLEEMLRMRAESKAIQLFVKIDDAVPQFIKTDEVKLRQILVNLVGNAIKFTQKGHVTLSVSKASVSKTTQPPETSQTPASTSTVSASIQGTVERSTDTHAGDRTPRQPPNTDHNDFSLFFTVQDTGSGIPADELPHLFDPFFRASRTRTTEQGTGLGLAISQRFVKMLGGEIQVQSIPNHGSTFSFSVQAQQADPEELPAEPLGEVIGLAAGQPNYRILVVEDVFSARQLLVALLSQVGFEIQTASNGKEAIAAYQTWHPHLIWMDMRMPIMDGYEATQQIRALPTAPSAPPTKIIAITASAFEEERTAVLASGCDDLVRKPFSTRTIFDKMAEHIGVQYQYQKQPATSNLHHPTSRPTGSSNQPTSPENDPSLQLSPEQMAVMPAAWLASFHQAAIAVDAEALHQLISQIPEEHAPLANSLTRLTQTFCFDELVALTQTYV
ncbi:MAG: ATP-binding protein [Cyanobacteria bacterium P01_F01_bin.53]